MSDAVWLPGLVVLAAGLLVGLAAAVRLRSDAAAERERRDQDLALKIRDLERRRDELYERLRRADEEELGAGDREALEIAAARTLRELDRAQKRQPKKPKTKKRKGSSAAPTPEAGPRAAAVVGDGPLARHPFLTGFAFGAGMLALLGLLIYWAQRDAQPAPQAGGLVAQRPPPEQPPHPVTGELSAEMAARITSLQGRLAADPGDIMATKELALMLLDSGQVFEAFERAQELLNSYPDDPDGLFIQGVVRVTMGQNDLAIELLDRVLANYPNNLQALLYRGLAFHQSDRSQQAIDTWEAGLEMAGGRHPDFEQLLATARGEVKPPAGTRPRPPEPAVPASAEDDYRVHLELGVGQQVAPGATLFVFLRGDDGGPPVAVKRINDPFFPVDLSLGPADVMMADDEIPASGLLVARLDGDGSASTRQEGDLEVEARAARGTLTRMVLGQ